MSQRTADEILDASYLEVRAKVLELAAVLDRLDRAPGGKDPSPRRDQLTHAMEMLLAEDPDRAAKVQHWFSRQYDPDWKTNLGVGTPSSK
ncbi:hypothetical protein RISK_003876 [Rhodopirellula islandica]|uniref:Uncharacterized protein n=1 Tax=Rhodopirellula islandica TaxID=595434 RepID=A0A0J1BCC9_RHOIS|nr:hypothetical protein [Rhodopirellula islandica]KLU04290.1 hypothetical protein RISK_003876 [Rhodopirellula islandica]